MAQPRSRSPLQSRNSVLPGRIMNDFYGEQYHSSVHSDLWRTSENVTKMEGPAHRDNSSSQGEQEVDHWAKFIEAIGRAGRQRYHPQDNAQRFEEKPPHHSPRRLPRERLSSPDSLHYGPNHHQRIPSPSQHRSEHNAAVLDRHYSHRSHWDSDSKSSGASHSLGRKHEWMEHGYHKEEHSDGYDRERSLKSNYRDHQPLPKRYKDMDRQEGHGGSYRGFSPFKAPVIVEHDHGIPKHHARSRDLPQNHDPHRSHERPRSLDPPRIQDFPRDRDPRNIESERGRDDGRRNDPLRSRDSLKRRRDHDHRGAASHERPSGSANFHRDETRISHPAVERRSPVLSRPRPREQPRLESRLREFHGQRAMNQNNDKDLRSEKNSRMRTSDRAWQDETKPRENQGARLGQGHVLNVPHRRNPSSSVGGMERNKNETLRIKVDMSRPVGHSSHLAYSSERQLSLDLVNVGRQRLDFLPMLKHSGTYRESAMHSGTFAQEIITLVHHVKENYFKGQDISLNERFSSEQHYSLEDVDEFAEEGRELEEIGQVINRPLGAPSSDTQIFCKIGPLQLQKRHVPDPSDLRYNLEMKRQQRLEGVKITIAGGNFSQMMPQSQDSQSVYEEDTHEGDDRWSDDWSEQMPQQTELWGGPQKKMAKSNINARWSFNRGNKRFGPRGRRNPKNGASQ